MTAANAITLGRIALVPVFAGALELHRRTGLDWARWAALVAFGLAAFLDAVDGWVARRFQQRTELGALLDPLADKLLLLTALGLLTWTATRLNPLPIWFGGIVLLRDFLLTFGFLLLRWATGGPRVRPHGLGKLATVGQMAAILWTLLHRSVEGQRIIAGVATGLTVASGMAYLGAGIQQWREGTRIRRSGPWISVPRRGRVAGRS